MSKTPSKLQYSGEYVTVSVDDAVARIMRIFRHAGCDHTIARQVATHLADTNLCGVESHGIMRTIQYVEQFSTGYMRADVAPQFNELEGGIYEVNGNGGIGIPAMQLAADHGCRLARENGMSVLAVRNVGHTGRLGAFAESAAKEGCLCIIIGGGNRQDWRQVAPYGGARAVLPTNPYCIGIPGGDQGPIVLDFATSKIAGGWVYAARSAGAKLPKDVMIDSGGNMSQDPEDYFAGGAILPAGGAKGYALALIAELIGEAMLGPVATEMNWLMITLDATRYREPSRMQTVAEEILAELRACPPAPGFDRVQIPGEREREQRAASAGQIILPDATWNQICDLDMD
ncbi:MAG: Ldh family oxidoreductase [Rhodospirillales bacterium]|nr:Ldh family oxidoreductase [Rhodospirillales bacterium]